MARKPNGTRRSLADRLADVEPNAVAGHDPLADADGQLLLDAIRAAGAAGYGFSLSWSRDQGAIKVGLLDDGIYQSIGWAANAAEFSYRLGLVMQLCVE